MNALTANVADTVDMNFEPVPVDYYAKLTESSAKIRANGVTTRVTNIFVKQFFDTKKFLLANNQIDSANKLTTDFEFYMKNCVDNWLIGYQGEI